MSYKTIFFYLMSETFELVIIIYTKGGKININYVVGSQINKVKQLSALKNIS